MIYVFGGRVAEGDFDKYAGLYSYNIESGAWRLLQYVLFVPICVLID
jgi:hypothetical protein